MNILPRTMDVLARTLGLALLLAWTAPASGQETQRISLNGPWLFAVDPVERGVELGWHLPGDVDETIGAIGAGKNWDRVTVPHAWPADPRYQHTGTAWYRRPLEVPEEAAGQRVRLAFEAVFYRTRVFVDGQFAGRHEGGYTPFTLDITPYVEPGQTHTLAVEVDNRWDLTTIPGARPGGEPGHQLYPWWDYGGLVRDVDLLIHPPLYVEKQKVEAAPDLESGTADVRVTAWVANATSNVREGTLRLELYREGEGVNPLHAADSADVRQAFTVMPHDAAPVRFRTTLPDSLVALWHPDAPHLYQARIVLEGEEADVRHAHAVTFGIRKVEVRDAQLLLNGEGVKMGGANRHIDAPGLGLVEPDSLVDLDLTLIKEGNMGLARLHHYPADEATIEWADRHGLLIIGEPGNWQLAPEQMDDSVIREKFRQQMREMVERDWNHPSVIGWSMGNEYPSWTPAGYRWTRDMMDYTRGLDSTRLLTFVAIGSAANDHGLPAEARSLDLVDLLCINSYSAPEGVARMLDRLHATWPHKPILIAEFGQRFDQAGPESRVATRAGRGRGAAAARLRRRGLGMVL